MLTTKPRGTSDILPGTVEEWQSLEHAVRLLFKNYNYKEIRTPIFEHTELFLRSVGETSDIVEKEMYSFEDKGLRHITLRPEGTASTVRAFLENRLFALALPQKLYYIGPMFRYDTPQAGRFRQFHQFGCEAIGSLDPLIDAEIISYAVNLFKQLGLMNLSVSLNSVGCDECRPQYENALKDYFLQHQEDLCPTCLNRLEKNPLRILDCKEISCKNIAKDAPKTIEHICDNCATHFSKVKEYLLESEIAFNVDTSLVRGLDYYTQTAFEVTMSDVRGQQNAVCGGGRYNKLVSECGGENLPAMGFAAGMERLLLLLSGQNISIANDSDPSIYFAPLDDKAKNVCFKMAQELRNQGYACEIDNMNKSLKAQMKTADRLNVQYSVIIGESECSTQQAIIRNMQDSSQELVPFDGVHDELIRKVGLGC